MLGSVQRGIQPDHRRRPAPDSVAQTHADGTYDWVCSGCGERHERYPPHRGPRRRLCRSCQNVRSYRKRNPLPQRRGWRSMLYEGWQSIRSDLSGGLD